MSMYLHITQVYIYIVKQLEYYIYNVLYSIYTIKNVLQTNVVGCRLMLLSSVEAAELFC